MMRVPACVLLLLSLACDLHAQGLLTVADSGRQAFSLPFPALAPADRPAFLQGRSLFRQVWVIAPSLDPQVDGLGPLYNRPACTSCHPANGRGEAPERAEQRMASMLVRLSLPGTDAHGRPRTHPLYGDQLNENGVPGVPGEGRATVRWEEQPFTFADGEQLSLRRPHLLFRELAHGPLDAVLTSARVGPPVFGLGLFEAVDDLTLEMLAVQSRAAGGQGHLNRVWSVQARGVRIGRFGLKANVANLREQVAAAMIGDMGITSTLHLWENCTPVQTDCQRMPNGGIPELGDGQLDAVVSYLAHLAVPARRDAGAPEVLRGETEFQALGCATCHRPRMNTSATADEPLLRNRQFNPYTDLLLHDMGEGLADGRPDFLASGREWRTAPLWGIGLARRLSASAGFLHDGRARSLTEAILWHGGEAQAARERFAALPKPRREALLAFLGSL
jgi:CxxC motif-containing protein (DUF1111 family)